MSDATPVKTPWHLWVVGVLTLLWNGLGVLDFAMTQTKNEAYMSQFTEEQLAYFYGFPMWFVVTWGGATIGAAAGSLLLLLRSRFAAVLFGAALVCLVLSNVYTFVLTDGLEMMGGTTPLIITVVVMVIAVGEVIYARRQTQRGVLR